jgi:hypothetical protein
MRRACLVVLVLLSLAIAVSGCGKDASTIAAWFGATDRPQPAPVAIDVLCDPSLGSTCTTEALRQEVERALRRAVERPGSVVRLWMQGQNIETTRMVALAKSPARRASGKHARADAESRWVAKESARLCSAATATPHKRIKRSPIAEAVAVVALAPPPTGGTREIIAITDALEMSAFGQFECGRLPKPEGFARSLAKHRVLPPGSLRSVDVTFCHVDLGAIDGGRCAVSLARAAEIRAIWTAALTAAGASHVEIRQGGLGSEITTGKEPNNVQTIQSK